MSERSGSSWRGVKTTSANAALAALYVLFASVHLQAFRASPRPSLLLVVAVEAVVVFLALVRAEAERASLHPWAIATTFGGTLAPLFLRPVGAASDVVAGQVIQTIGSAAGIAGALSLNRCFGLLPAYRGVKTSGAYRIVRHPLYAAYLVATVGYLVSNFSVLNVVVVGIWLGCQMARVVNEERLLSPYPEYAAYKERTRWRLMPFVF